MSDLVKRIELGDTRFGIPADTKLLNKPWGFYEFLRLPKTATRDQIKEAYKRLALQLHPDKGGRKEDFQNLEKVASVLLDDGGTLGEEYSQKVHYDMVSSSDEYFDGFIQFKEERTTKFSEIILINLEMRKKAAMAEEKASELFPDFKELKEKLKRARSEESIERIAKKLGEMVRQALEAEIPEERSQQEKEEHKIAIEKRVANFKRSIEHNLSHKILDIFYVGDSEVSFGREPGSFYSETRFGLLNFEELEYVLKLILTGEVSIPSARQVHFKARECKVNIYDEHLTGIFHVMKGSISVWYAGTSYGGVIRARAPQIESFNGFERKGDLFIPERFATQNWWKKKPALDLAVQEGPVSLGLAGRDFSHFHYSSYDGISLMKKDLNLKSIIQNTYKKW
ncbi:DnaJ domain-containing protein [Candidatus Woesearchaeota archaeon]|nr:DnaJ domain-containing protein [Candidatus Woesearchaeota archaeon]